MYVCVCLMLASSVIPTNIRVGSLHSGDSVRVYTAQRKPQLHTKDIYVCSEPFQKETLAPRDKAIRDIFQVCLLIKLNYGEI